MAQTEPPPSLTACLTPFDSAETRRLRRFHSQLAKLSSYRFLKESAGPMQLTATFASGQVGDIQYVGPDREALDAVAPAFRELYGGGRWNHTSATAIAKLISHHAHAAETEPGEQLAGQLRDFRRTLKNRAKRDPRIGILVERPGQVGSSSSLTPNDAIDLFLNGALFHYELEKADEFEDTPPYEQSLVMMVHSAIRDFAPLWQKLDRIVSAILTEPRLLGEVRAA